MPAYNIYNTNPVSRGPFNIYNISPPGGGTWNMQRGEYEESSKYKRKRRPGLLTYDEFMASPRLVEYFGNYRDYFDAFRRGKVKLVQRMPSAGRAGGGGVAIPKPGAGGGMGAQVHTDIRGIPKMELAGQGVHRGLGGQTIPQTPEQVAAQGELERQMQFAVPIQRELTAQEAFELAQAPKGRAVKAKQMELESARLDLAKLQNEAARAEEKYLATMSPAERWERTTARGQAQQRLELTRQENDRRAERYKQARTDKEYFMYLADELKRGQQELSADLRFKNQAAQLEWRRNMAQLRGEFPGTPEAVQKQLDITNRQIQLADYNAKIAVSMKEYDEAQEAREAYSDYQYWLLKEKQKELTWKIQRSSRETAAPLIEERAEMREGVEAPTKPLPRQSLILQKYPNAKQARDGNWYIPDPDRPGKYLRIPNE